MSPKPFPLLSPANKLLLVEELLQWSLANGLVMYPPKFDVFAANNAPITLFPTAFPRDMFERAVAVQQLFNSLYASVVARQKPWLLEVVAKLASFDSDFTGKLYETYVKAVEIGGGSVAQPLTLGVFRSDYMYDELTHAIKQIEFNTVSVSFGGLSSKIGAAHTYLNRRGSYDDDYSQKYYNDSELPVSESLREIARGLAHGNLHYNGGRENTLSVVLFVVQNGERNCFDQRHIEYELLETHGIKSYRLSLEQIKEHTTINLGNLYMRQTMDEVSVVYFRSGYAPLDYESNPTETWAARLHLETSLAIKCPSLLTQLSGAKKIQQVLTATEVVTSFLPDIAPDALENLLSTFVSIYPLDDSEEGKHAKKIAFETPEKFVLKPQREGGGNNVYKQDIPGFLKSLDEKDWGAYILMELIHPPTHANTILRNDELFHEDIVSELGVFGNVLFNENSGEVLVNENAGFLLRSKFSSSDEGGVAAGFGCVDNVYLY